MRIRCGPSPSPSPNPYQVVGIRWNETDRGALNTLPPEDVEAFYAYAAALQVVLVRSEASLSRPRALNRSQPEP